MSVFLCKWLSEILNNYSEKLHETLRLAEANIQKMESSYGYETTMGKGKIHYYKNLKTGEINFYDAKMKISIPKDLRIIEGITDLFGIVDLDSNFIPQGVS